MLRLLTQATTFYLRPLAFMVVKCFDITHIMQVKWLTRQCVLVKNEDMVVGWFWTNPRIPFILGFLVLLHFEKVVNIVVAFKKNLDPSRLVAITL